MKMMLILAAAAATTLAAPAFAQSAGNAAGLLGGAPSNATGPQTVPQPVIGQAGNVIYKAGEAGTVASGAHSGGPAPVVSAAVPQAQPFTGGVTDGTGKIGESTSASGNSIARTGLTVNPGAGAQAATRTPDAVHESANRLASIPK